jgi:hypothetical protein
LLELQGQHLDKCRMSKQRSIGATKQRSNERVRKSAPKRASEVARHWRIFEIRVLLFAHLVKHVFYFCGVFLCRVCYGERKKCYGAKCSTDGCLGGRMNTGLAGYVPQCPYCHTAIFGHRNHTDIQFCNSMAYIQNGRFHQCLQRIQTVWQR